MADAPRQDVCTGLREELRWILTRFEAADERLRQAATIPEKEAAAAARREAVGDHYGCTEDVSSLFLLMLRQAVRHDKNALRWLLVDLLKDVLLKEIAPELGEFVRRALARREGGTNGRA
jgi:hypothetical protein